ncbi:MAG: LacI family transcriptional regulator [Actinomycetia bacterium]|nr:LacI family transcriptional regulator [Actinomycetes bacterium]
MNQKDSSITMRTVAQRAGVSYQTVSRVINDAAGVAPETRTRVLAAMRELGYRPSLAARSLARNRSEIVGLVLPSSVEAGFASAHLLQVVGGVDRGVSDNDYTTLLSSPKESETELSAFRRLIRQRTVDGVLVEASMGEEGVKLLVEAGYPVTVIGHTALDVPSVCPDDESGAYVAMQHLLALGHRRIAIVTSGEGQGLAVRARMAGCERALADAGLTLDQGLVATGNWSIASGRAAAEGLLDREQPPTAYFCFNDSMAIGVLQLLRERGIDVPREVSVAGFDDTPPAPLLTPPLTSVRVFSAEQGERAARTLIGILRGMTRPGAPVVLPSQLVVRGSTAPAHPR